MHKIYYFSCRGDGLKPHQKPVKVAEKDTIQKGESKLQYIVRDTNGTIKLFEKFVRTKYGFTKGIIGQEVLEALEDRMALHGFEIFKHRSIDYIPEGAPAHKKLKRKPEVLLSYLEEKYKECETVRFRDIQDIIIQKMGRTDRRTHKSYTDALRSTEFLIQPDGVKDYDYYYFKELPQSREARRKHVIDVQTKLVFPGDRVFNALPKDGEVISMKRLVQLTGLKEGNVINGVKQLEKMDLVKLAGYGLVKAQLKNYDLNSSEEAE